MRLFTLINPFLKKYLGYLTVFTLFISFLSISTANAQDTVRVSLRQFIQIGLNHSDQVKAEESKVNMAKNNIDQAKSMKLLPKFQLTTNHSVVPGVESDSVLSNGKPLPKSQWYLDPNLKNDWSRWSIYSQVQIQGIQPIFTWGALNNAVKAATKGAEAARDQFLSEKSKLALKLYQLYYSRVLTNQLLRLLGNAQKEFDKADRKIKKMQQSNDSSLDEADVYKFKIYKSQFEIKADEVKQNDNFIKKVWDLVLGTDSSKVYLPKQQFLDPVDSTVKSYSYYQSLALTNRPELKALKAAKSAAKFGLKAKKAQMLPTLFLGLGGEYVYTPRPTERTPMIGNRFSYLNLAYSFGIRQNLDFWGMKNDIDKMKIKYNEIKYSRDAAVQGIRLELLNSYKTAKVAEVTYKKTGDALHTSTEWLRQEQINYDLGIGKIKNLLDAVKSNLELEAEYRKKVYDYDLDMAKLYKASGIPIQNLQKIE
ncbi:MAG TPA: TolC family protein [Balneolales bacterium]|nr:TolC family protein [Balneolales bacterium]